MTTFVNNDVQSGNIIYAADHNEQGARTAAVLNGGIDSSNLADNAVGTSELASSAVTSTKINFGGSGAGIWWEEIGRTTLGVAGDSLAVSGIPARKYLMVLSSLISTGGTISPAVTFNGDTANNYSQRYSDNGGADATSVSRANLALDSGSAAAVPQRIELSIVNITAQEKQITGKVLNQGTAGAGFAPNRREVGAKWANTSAQITSITATNIGTGDFAIGSELIVLGHN